MTLLFLALASASQHDGLVRYASLTPSWPVQYEPGKVTITYAGHSTYVIETPGGVRAATDFSGYHGYDPLPRVVTMNRAHSTHYTMNPDPGIEHVLPGWNTDGDGPAEHGDGPAMAQFRGGRQYNRMRRRNEKAHADIICTCCCRRLQSKACGAVLLSLIGDCGVLWQ